MAGVQPTADIRGSPATASCRPRIGLFPLDAWSSHPPDEPSSSSSAGRSTESLINQDIDMSGPIVRRYGFPNFEKIFGERPIEHGVEETESPDARPDGREATESKPQSVSPKDALAKGEAKRS